MAIQTVLLTGKYADIQGNPLNGRVTITPTASPIRDTSGNVVLAGPFSTDLVAGSFSEALYATDDPGLDPTGFGYTVSVKLTDRPMALSTTLALPAALGTLDMSDAGPSTLVPSPVDAPLARRSDLANLAKSVIGYGPLDENFLGGQNRKYPAWDCVTRIGNAKVPAMGGEILNDGLQCVDEFALEVWDGIAYLVMGFNYGVNASGGTYTTIPWIRRFNIATKTWLAPIATPTTAGSPGGINAEAGYAAIINGILYFGGGDSYGGEPNAPVQFWSYNIASGVFTRLVDSPVPVDYGAWGTGDGKLWVLGGSGASLVAAYNPATNTWAAKPAPPNTITSGEHGIQVGRKLIWPGLNRWLNLDDETWHEIVPNGKAAHLWGSDPITGIYDDLGPGDAGATMPANTGWSLPVVLLNGMLYCLDSITWCLDPATMTYTRSAAIPLSWYSGAYADGGDILTFGGNGRPWVEVWRRNGEVETDLFRVKRLRVFESIVSGSAVITKGACVGVFAGGEGNQVSNSDTFATGYNNVVTGWAASVQGGYNEAAGTRAHAEGQYTKASNTQSHSQGIRTKASGISSHAQGNTTEAAGNASDAIGLGTLANGMISHAEGVQSVARMVGSHAHGGGQLTAAGDCQYVRSVLGATTTDATATPVTTRVLGNGDGMTAETSELIVTPNRIVGIRALVAARKTDGLVGAAWSITAAVRISSGGTPTIIGTPTVTPLGVDAGASTWAVALSTAAASTIRLLVSGAAATTIRWSATIETQEVG